MSNHQALAPILCRVLGAALSPIGTIRLVTAIWCLLGKNEIVRKNKIRKLHDKIANSDFIIKGQIYERC